MAEGIQLISKRPSEEFAEVLRQNRLRDIFK